MGLFDMFKKKNCDLCGGDIGLLGNRKLEDGNCCKHCAAKLSPWFDDRRNSTVAQIRQQLAYREENARALEGFCPTRTIGEEYLVYFEEGSRRFLVARDGDYREQNPDILSYDQVLSCEMKIDESESEILREVTDKEGNTREVSYIPKRYLYQYDFEMIIRVRHPFFDDLRFPLNSETLELENRSTNVNGILRNEPGAMDPTRNARYRRYADMGEEIVRILTEKPEAVPQAAPVQEVSAGPKFCTNCGAPAEGGKFCTHCGSPM